MVLKRFVKGIGEEAVFQKRAPAKRPDWVEVVELHYASGTSAAETVVRDDAGLAWVVNLGCVDLNPHPVRAQDLDHPVELRIDLDPVPGVTWAQIVDVALVVREVLTDVGLSAWPKTSGSRGIHVYAPLDAAETYPQVRLAAQTVAREVERRAPDLATSRWWKEERQGVFVDFNQNAKDRTVASAWSVRATPDARVSLPLRWDEVASVRPGDWTLGRRRSGTPTVTPGPAWTREPGSLDALLALAQELGPVEKPPKGTGRRAQTMPLIEIARARTKAEALAGLDAVEGQAPEGRPAAGGVRRARRRHARQQLPVVPDPGQPAARARRPAPGAGRARGRPRPVGGLPGDAAAARPPVTQRR